MVITAPADPRGEALPALIPRHPEQIDRRPALLHRVGGNAVFRDPDGIGNETGPEAGREQARDAPSGRPPSATLVTALSRFGISG